MKTLGKNPPVLTRFATLRKFAPWSNALPRPPSNHYDLFTIGDAAKLLDVSVSTLRNWDRGKKLTPGRHPIKGYRLYRRSEVQTLREKIIGSRGTSRPKGER